MLLGRRRWPFGLTLVAVALLAAAGPLQPLGVLCSSEDNFHCPNSLYNTTKSLEVHPTLSGRQNGKVDLRILNLGASIVWGVGSSTEDSYRAFLRDQLVSVGWNVNMVGSKRNGNMKDNDVEATKGDTIEKARVASKLSLEYQPNVVLIQVGSNDCAQHTDTGAAGARMRRLIEELLNTPGFDRTTVILSTLIPNFDESIRHCEEDEDAPGGGINRQYRALASDLRFEGKRVVLAEMNPPAPNPGHGWITRNDMSDATHPNDSGYRKMAYVFWNAIEVARAEGKLLSPNHIELGKATPGCEKTSGDGVYAGGLTQRGSGVDNGIYRHESMGKGIVLTLTSAWDRNQWRFARLFSRNKDDLVGWFEESPGVVKYGVWKNNGDYNTARFDKIADLSVDDNCIPRGVRFIDINADGLDDFVCIAPNGDAYASINEGNGNANTPPKFHSIGLWKANVGWSQEHIVLADIDGDGRADYCYWDNGGNIWCWRNGWIDDVPKYWQDLGMRFPAKGFGDAHGVRFEDLNGDGRDDWLWVRDDGQTSTWTNSRSCARGHSGDGLNVAWRQGFLKGQTSGPTHLGVGDYSSTGLRNRIHFARIYGEPQEFGELGKQDYVFMEHIQEGDTHKFNVRVWKNISRGGTKVKADGVKYCNMMGHPNGNVDYVWTWSTGKMIMYPSRSVQRISKDESWWGPVVDPIWTPPFNIDRRDLHLTDWDGDGACDIVWADSNNNNRVQVWRNKFKETGRWEWDYFPNPAPELSCNQKRGLGIRDLPVRFADVTGNGRGDYLCMELDGRSSGWVHNDAGGWERINQFKFTEDKDRANLEFADANGDGRADMIWVDKFTGEGWVWYNEGRIQAGESSFKWRKPTKPSYSGYKAGTCTYYPDMDGDGRADQHSILGTFDNRAETSLNLCGGKADSVDTTIPSSPNLPVMPGTTPGEGTGGGGDCSAGSGPNDFRQLCEYSCKFGFCPEPCTCTRYGTPEKVPDVLPGVHGLPSNGRDLSYANLCNFACSRGFCPSNICRLVSGNVFLELPDCNKRKWECSTTCEIADNIGETPATRWKSVDAGLVLDDIYSDWVAGVGFDELRGGGATSNFPLYASFRYGGMTPIKGDYRGPHPFNCGKVLAADSTCHIAQFSCGRLDFPAHYLNLASFVFVKEAFSGLYNSFERVNTKGIVDQLAKDFGPSGDDGPLAALKTALGWLDGILGVVGLASWKRGAQQFFDLVGDVSEAGNLFADLYEQFAGEAADAKEKEMEAKDNIEDAVLLFKTTAQAGTENMLQHLFSGTEDGTNDLKRLIADGKFIEPLFGEVDDTATNATRRVEKLMQKRLIPAAWESDEDLKTVIIAYEDKKGDGGSHSPIHLWPWGPLTGEQENVAFGWLSDETASETRLEYREGGTNWVLWLLVYFNIENKSMDDLRWTFRVPNGFDKLGPDNKYYEGMRWQDLAISAFRGWIHADKDQGYGIVKEPSKADNPKEKGYFYEDDWRTPGFFSGIPICGLDVIHHAVQAEVYGRCETWPCCCSVAWNMPQVPCSKVPDGSPPFRTMEEAVLTQALADKKASQMRTGNLTLTSNDTISVNGTMVPSRKYSRGQLVPKEQV